MNRFVATLFCKTIKTYEDKPQTLYEWLLASLDIAGGAKRRLRAEHAALNPSTLKKDIERQLKNIFILLSNLNCESMKRWGLIGSDGIDFDAEFYQPSEVRCASESEV